MAPSSILGRLTSQSEFPILPSQRDAWLTQIPLLQEQLTKLPGWIFLEFNIPRMGHRADAVLLVGPLVVVIEFKVGARTFSRAAVEQVWDYALDLKNFHEASHTAAVLPILLATEADQPPPTVLKLDQDRLFRPLSVGARHLRSAIDLALQSAYGSAIDPAEWVRAPYRPTPTIVEAARALYAQHSVQAIARHDAGAKNLHSTARRLEELVDAANHERRKIICFVTGVPGAGKTLVGLNLATRRGDPNEPTHAVFLSGNGPLVAVLREALTRDEVDRRKHQGERVRKGAVAVRVKSFIQNVHHFRDEALTHLGAPSEHVAIFDEAQRAWNLTQTARFMRQRRRREGFSQSEPEFLLSYMDRHKDWAAVICLVGGGQEIHTGEAGIGAWLEAVGTKFRHWHAYISPRLTDSEYAAGRALEIVGSWPNAHLDESLHLAVSMRSFRAEDVSAFVKALLDCDRQQARRLFATLRDRYPIVLTRDLGLAKDWVRAQARGTERYGLLASSRAIRLKPHAVDVRVAVNPVHWFLNDRHDIRSSYYLEDAATEFQVQGLEVDWACVSWDGDLRFGDAGWSFHDFRGSRWCSVAHPDHCNYLRNAYRVLLTRARQGMVVFVPPGDQRDPTRAPSFYDPTFNYLRELGISTLA